MAINNGNKAHHCPNNIGHQARISKHRIQQSLSKCFREHRKKNCAV
jgi:hypothetical protein